MTPEERDILATIKIQVNELVVWKRNVDGLLFGTLKGEIGYFHKGNIVWRILILWPVTIGGVACGAAITLAVEHFLRQ